jgi:hypothetical protein
MAWTNQGRKEPARSGQPSNPRKRVAAVLKDIKRQPYPFPEVTIVAVQCECCGQGLLDLLRIPRSFLYPRSPLNPPSMFFQPPTVASSNGLYIERNEVHGWRRDGNTLRPTLYHLQQQQKAQTEIWAKPQAETKRTRQSLAHHSRRSSGRYFTRPLGKRGNPWTRPKAEIILELAPEWIECPQCDAHVHVAPTMAPHGNVM